MTGSIVGLDVGSTTVRGVEVRLGGARPVVRRTGRAELPDGAVEGGLVRDRSAVAATIRQLWKDAGFSTRSVRLGVGSPSVLVRQLDLPWMPVADLRRSLRYQVADLLPVPVDDANLDLVWLGEHEVPGEDGRPRRCARILLVATARDAVDGLVRAVQDAGLRADGADLSAFGVIRSARRSDRPVQGTEAVVDIGAETVTVAVHASGLPLFVRVAPGMGGAMLTRTLVEQLGCSVAEAEQLKRSPLALPAPGMPAMTRAQSVLHEAVGRLLAEVQATLQFHAASDPRGLPARVLLAGQGSHLEGLGAYAEEVLRTPVMSLDDTGWDDVVRRRRGAEAPTAQDAVALGLCLGAVA